MGKDFLNKLKEITESNSSNPQFGVNELARELSMSHSSLLRKVHAHTGKSINQFIREIRMRKAMELLLKEEMTAAEVAFRMGFSSPAHFSNNFREFFGYPPGEIKKRNANGTLESGSMEISEPGDATEEPIQVKSRIPDPKMRTERMIVIAATGIVIVFTGFVLLALLTNSNKAAADLTKNQEITIAVLPFRDLSIHESQPEFIYGFEQSLLSSLIKIKDFTVRTELPYESYRDTKKTMQIIGKEINVKYLITGALGIEGDQIKFCAQLIESKTNKIRWARDTIRKTKDDVFAIQSELAKNIAVELKAELSPEEIRQIDKKPTENQEAYNYYRQGIYWSNKDRSTDMKSAIGYFQKAVGLDPRFALAYAGMGIALTNRYKFSEDRREQVLQDSKQAIDKALELEPDLYEANVALAIYYGINWEDEKALKLGEKLIKLHPGSFRAYLNCGVFCRRLGKWDQAIRYLTNATELSPESVMSHRVLAFSYNMLRDYPNAVKYDTLVIGINPVTPGVYRNLSEIALKWNGDVRKAREILEEAEQKIRIDGWDIMEYISQYVTLDLIEGDYEHALGQLSRCQVDFFPNNYTYYPKFLLIATVYGFIKKPDLERAYYDSTRLYLEKLQRTDPAWQKDHRVMSALGIAYAGLGFPERAIELGKKASENVPESGGAIGRPYLEEDLAYIYTLTGKYPQAIEVLEDLLSKPGPLTSKLLEMDPRWAPLRNLPGFKKLLRNYPVK